jgi:hypothetical protein
MKKLTAALALAAGAAVTGCSDRVQSPCTADVRLGLGIIVADEATGAHICDAGVTARDGGYSETLRPMSWAGVSGCLYVGAAERHGTYSVQAEAAGYAPGTLSNVTVPVTEDGCHVQMVRRELQLRPTGQR